MIVVALEALEDVLASDYSELELLELDPPELEPFGVNPGAVPESDALRDAVEAAKARFRSLRLAVRNFAMSSARCRASISLMISC